jgi:hypothetical protein
MPRNLEPQIIAPPASSLELGMLLFIPDYNATDRAYRALRFQYNPESVSRVRQGEWASDRVRDSQAVLAQQNRSLLDGHRGGGLYAKSEVISFKLVFDASELALRSSSGSSSEPGGSLNVLPELGFLEQVALGGDEPMKTETTQALPPKQAAPGAKTAATVAKPVAGNDKTAGQNACGKTTQKPTYTTKIHGTAPSELLLVLGPRTFPVVLTSLTINEQRYNPALEPIHAECDCKFRVLESQEVKNNKPATVAFAELLRKRKAWSAEAELGAGDARVAAIAASLEGK